MVRLLRNERPDRNAPTIRACIMIGKVLKLSGMEADASNKDFVKVCLDILDSEISHRTKESATKVREDIIDGIKKSFYKEG
ncbi:MAG: hypothetical protein SCARUB_00550 [Candidatus Scalindua rubra]|uniref:Uncharacterized protein n=1 Tax=Candidatus Scalindua rubra TaxID=1872076 RepID=A0A1E3XF78_9BACT|nr:MAG: hypothetical protein SCARUB_00550 [Candidatus Scalindua rubra]